MKKIVIASAILIAGFAAPGFAQTDKEAVPYPGLEGMNCVALVEKLDVTLTEVKISEELQVQVLELREKGITEISDGDEEACTILLTAAFQLLVPVE